MHKILKKIKTIEGKYRGKAATVYNEHIAKIAALPRGIKICVFLLPCSR